MSAAQAVGPDDEGGLTIKFGPGFEAPWYTPRGTPRSIVAQLKEFFGLTDVEVADKSPADIVVLATHKIQHSWASVVIETGLPTAQRSGGVGSSKRPAGARPANPARGGGSGSEPAEEDPLAGIKAAIAEASTEDELKVVYAHNQQAFKSEQEKGAPFPLLEAWKARKAEIAG